MYNIGSHSQYQGVVLYSEFAAIYMVSRYVVYKHIPNTQIIGKYLSANGICIMVPLYTIISLDSYNNYSAILSVSENVYNIALYAIM